MRNIIIFIDGFPWRDVSRLKSFNRLCFSRAMKPGLGYSVNLHHELLTGKCADQVGFFSDFEVSKPTHRLRYSSFDKLLMKVTKTYPKLTRLLYKIAEKLSSKRLGMLPIPLTNYVRYPGTYLFQENDGLRIGATSYKVFNYDNSLKFGERDKRSISDSLDYLKRNPGSVIITLTEFDAVFHNNDIGSPKYTEKCNLLDGFLNQILDEYSKNSNIIVFSDHGMSRCNRHIQIDLEGKFGLPFENGFGYFYDSLHVRLYRHDDNVAYDNACRYLNTAGVGQFLSFQERSEYGLLSSTFGDDIFVLNEGLAFVPNYLGYGLFRNYHGYHPSNEDQLGIVGANWMPSGVHDERTKTVSSVKVHELLNEISMKEG